MDRQNFILGVKKFILMLLQAGKSQDLEWAVRDKKGHRQILAEF